MLDLEASVVVRRPAAEILEWILDLERYRQADTKITTVPRQEPGRVVFRGRLRGIPTPADANTVHHVPGESLTFRGAPRWTRRMLDFEGSFRCEPIEDGTLVVHRERLGFKPWPVRVVVEAWLRRWLERDIAEEMERLGRLVDAAP